MTVGRPAPSMAPMNQRGGLTTMLKTITRLSLIAAAATVAAAAPASASTALCVPKTPGQTAFSGGDNPSVYCAGSQTMLMPDSVADQQKLIDLLPYISYKASGVGKKPTLVFTGLNIQISKKEFPGFGNTDGTGNLVIGDSGMRYSDQTVTDGRYSGSENLIVGGANQWRGRGSAIFGEGNRVDSTLGLVHGQNNVVSGLQTFVTGLGRTVSDSYRVIADGSGADVHWARYDATGKLVDSSEPMNVGDAYASTTSTYSLTRWNGVDTAKCAVSVQIEGPDSTDITAVASNYFGYAYARFSKTTATGAQAATGVPHTVIANCNRRT
jgi:hypothetical protein